MFEAFKEKRRLKRLQNSKLIKDEYLAIIMNDKNPDMRKAAFEKVQDSLTKGELFSIVMNNWYHDRCEAAFEKVKGSLAKKELLSIVSYNSNPELRKAAFEMIMDNLAKEELFSIVTDNKNIDMRKAAFEKVKDYLTKEELLSIGLNNESNDMRLIALEKIKDRLSQAEYYSLFLSGHLVAREFALARITDNGILMDIIQSAGDELRMSQDEGRRESAAALLLAIYRRQKEPQINDAIQTYSGSVIHRNDHMDQKSSHSDEETAYNGWFCDHSDSPYMDHNDQGRDDTYFTP